MNRAKEKPYNKTYDPLPGTLALINNPNNVNARDSLEKFILDSITEWIQDTLSSSDKSREYNFQFDKYQKKDIVEDVIMVAKLWGRFFVATSGDNKAQEINKLCEEFRYNLDSIITKACKREYYFSTWKETFFCIWGKKIPHSKNSTTTIRVKDFVFERILAPFWIGHYDFNANNPFNEYQRHDCFRTFNFIDESHAKIIKSKYINRSQLTSTQSRLLRTAQENFFKQLLRQLWRPLIFEIEKDKLLWAINQLSPVEARIAEKIVCCNLSSVDRELQLRGRLSFSEISRKVRENILMAWAYDLHVHTRTSDGAEFPANLEAQRYIKNLDGVAIMDHEGVGINALKEYSRLYSEGDNGRLIIGQEIEVDGGLQSGIELSVFFQNLDPEILRKQSEKKLFQFAEKLSSGSSPRPKLEALVDKLIEMDPVFVITHPYGRLYSLLHDTDEILDRLIGYLKAKGKNPESLAFEIYNAKSGASDDVDHANGKSRKISNHYPKDKKDGLPYNFPICAGSDSHLGFFDIGSGYCILKRPIHHTSDEFVDNLRNALICKPRSYWFSDDSFRKKFNFIFSSTK